MHSSVLQLFYFDGTHLRSVRQVSPPVIGRYMHVYGRGRLERGWSWSSQSWSYMLSPR